MTPHNLRIARRIMDRWWLKEKKTLSRKERIPVSAKVECIVIV